MAKNTMTTGDRDFQAEKILAELLLTIHGASAQLPAPVAAPDGPRMRYAPDWQKIQDLADQLRHATSAAARLAANLTSKGSAE